MSFALRTEHRPEDAAAAAVAGFLEAQRRWLDRLEVLVRPGLVHACLLRAAGLGTAVSVQAL